MELADFNTYCGAKAGTQTVIQWGGAHVWKVRGKIFAIASHWGAGTPKTTFKISFKASDFSYEILTQQPGIISAPYLGRYKWVQLVSAEAMNDDEIKAYIDDAYQLVVAKLTKAQRRDLQA